jgi:hypothetical protein
MPTCYKGAIIISGIEWAERSQVYCALLNHFEGMVRLDRFDVIAECDLTECEVVAIISFCDRYKYLGKLQITDLNRKCEINP